MTTLPTTSRTLHRGIIAAASAVLVAIPFATARADDDDWDDDLEDYYEELEDRREEARERYEEWREDERERWEDWYDDDDHWRRHRRYHGYYGPGIEYRAYRPAPGPVYYSYPGPVYRSYYYDSPRAYRYYEGRPMARYYGTPGLGYTEDGRHRSLRIGDAEIHWDRD